MNASRQAKPASPQIGVSYMTSLPPSVVDDFIADITSDSIDIEVRRHAGVFAGIQWLMPTAVFLVITHSYFNAIFSELGKDHYKLLKRAVASLYHRMSTFRLGLYGTPGKIADEPLYSVAFSILVVTGEEINFKFLIQPELSGADTTRALEEFFSLMESMFAGSVPPDVLARLEQGRVVGHTLLLAFNFEKGTIVTVDPLPQLTRVP